MASCLSEYLFRDKILGNQKEHFGTLNQLRQINAPDTHPYNFMYMPEVQRAFRALQKGIDERTEDTDTLIISIPATSLENKSKISMLPLSVTDSEDSNGIKIISFDWFTLPEKRTGFANTAFDFVSSIIKCLNAVPEDKVAADADAETLKQQYTPGMKLRVIKVADDYGLPEGTEVTVDFVDDIGQIHVNESGLALISGVDEFDVINICTRCGKVFDYPPAISRKDNKSPVCRVCGAVEALEAVGASDGEKERVLAEVSTHENG